METLEDLVSYQKELDQEEQFLTKLILQIDEQINRLQVEQMELQSAMYESDSTQQKQTTPDERSSEQLILNVPINIKNVLKEEVEEEEEEDDEDEEDEQGACV